MGLDKEIASGQGGPLHRAMQRYRAFVGRHLILLWVYRTLVIALGFICIVAGLVMLVTPGPGWLFIFMGMSLWGTEFHWAHRLNLWAKAKVLAAWRTLERRRHRRGRARQTARWAHRPNKQHYCPSNCHYHL